MTQKINVGQLEKNMENSCSHLDQVHSITPSAKGCEDCLKIGGHWVNLRICLTCGYVGCCDSSPNKHASKHARHVGHPIIQSFQPTEVWGWCYVDELVIPFTEKLYDPPVE